MNIALWIAAVPVTLAAIRVLMFSRGDATLLRALVETLQVLPVLIASTLQVLPWAFGSLGAILLFNASSRRAVGSWILRSQLSAILAVLICTVIVFIAPLNGLAGLVVLYGLVFVVAIIGRRKTPWAQRFNSFAKKIDNDNPGGAFLAILIMPLLVQQLVGFDAFWLPREAVTVTGRVVDGYVLDVTGEWTTMLSPERVVLRFPTAQVTARAVCDQGETTTLLNLNQGPRVVSDVCNERREPGPAVVE